MQILPVLDLMRGQVVRGMGGQRDAYRPIISRLVEGSDPVAIARALRSHFGLSELYLADLDSIMGGPPALALYQVLQRDDFRLWVDAGLRIATEALALREAGVATIVAGLETLAGAEEAARLCEDFDNERIVFSIDLKGGRSLGRANAWPCTDSRVIAEQVIAAGVRRLLVLDLAHVGGGTGTGTEDLCRELSSAHPHVSLAAGGGVGGLNDLRRLEACGVDTVLVASALHDGRLRPCDTI